MICEIPALEQFIADLQPALMPRQRHRAWDWIREHGRMPDGKPFDGERVPWCRGVCDAWDDPETRQIALQWGTRLGKTTIAMQLMAMAACTKPRSGLFATSTQSLARRTVMGKIYPLLAAIDGTRAQLPHERWWTATEIRLASSFWHVAWSGSETQLADLSAFYGWANEIDKWSMNQRQEGEAGEGDSLDQFEERFKEFQNAKLLFECSPTTASKSRIEAKLKLSNDCRYWVPCPRCGAFQVLRLGSENPAAGGLLFDKHADGSLDAALARTTARYKCAHCPYEIGDELRHRMMNRGVWAPAGCGVDKRGRVTGTPHRSARIWGGQLSSLYSLQLRWGDVAERFVGDVRRNQLRVFVNGWLAETWQPYKSKNEPEDIGRRLATELPPSVIPAWATWLFAAFDVQGDHYVYWVVACDALEREHLVKHGTCETLEEARDVITAKYEREDGGAPQWPAVTAMDSGFRTEAVYKFCQTFRGTPHRVVPVKGANTDCAGEPYEVKQIGMNEGKSARTKKALIRAGRGLTRIRISPYYYEPITQRQLDELSPGDPGALSLNAEAAEDFDLLSQLCNGAEAAEPSKMDPDRHLWIKPRDGDPNDMRDAKKYARCMMDWHFKRNWKRAEKMQPVCGAAAPARQVAAASESTGSRRRERFRPEFRRRASR